MDTLKSNPLSGYLAHLEESSDAIFSRGFDKRIISWNSGAARMFGYTKQEAEGKKTTEIGYFIATNDFIEQVERKVLDNGFWESELSFFHKDGHKIIGAVSANAIKNESGEVISFLFVIKDISRIKQLESELKEANEALEAKVIIRTKELKAAKDLYHNIFKNSPMPMWIFDIKTKKFLDINELAIKVYGYTREEFLAMTLMDIRTDEEKELLKQLNLDDNSENFNQGIWKHRLKNGNIIYVEIVAHPIQFNGVEAKLVLANNVTQRVTIEKQIETNEKRFRALIENSHDGITLMDENATVLYRSPSTERITGRSEAEMKGIDATTHIHPDDLIIIQNTIHSLLESPGKLHPIAFRNKHKDGSYRWLEGTIVNLLNDENVKAVVINLKDVSERIEAEEKLYQSEYQLRYSLDNMIEGVQIIDTDWRYTYVNDSLVKDSKYSREELIGFTMMEKYPGIENTSMFTELKACMEERRKGFLENEFTFPDGTTEYFELSIQPIPQGIFILSLNITDRVLAMQQIAASELRFRTLVEYGDDIVTLFDKDFKVTYRSPTSERLTGWKDEDMMGQSGARNVHPDDLDYTRNVIQKILANPGVNEYVSVRLLNKNGHYIIVEGVIINLLDNKNINAIVFNYRDVTEKRTALDKLAGSELRFRTLLENGNDIVSLFDENFRIIYRSPSAFKVMGWSDEEMLNEKWTKNIHPNDLEIADYTVKAILEYPNIPVDVSIRMKHKLGYYLWVEGKIVNLLQDEKIKAIVFNFRDITERKLTADELFASEKQYRSLVERISDAFVTLDNDLCFTYMNTVAEEMFDVETGYLLGKKMYEEYSTGVGGDIFKAVHLALNSKTSQRFDSYSDVFNKWITGSIYPSETGLTCFFRDTTEIKKLELNLLEQKHKEQTKLISATLEAQEKERNAIGIELHDNVNQILVGTTMFLSMLKKKPVKDDALIDECIDNIKSAINENRKIAHVLVGPDLENKHIGDQIKSLCESMLEVNGIKSITHFENYDFTLIPKEKKVALYRIVQELFTNVIKYAEATEVNIYLLTANEKVLSMRVADNGKGMDQKKVTSGIGLRNIKSRLVVFDGEMKIVTEPGKGFALEVEIPLG